MTAVVVRGDAGRLPLPDASVDLIVTSPPYFALRSYTDGGRHYAGQLGSEATPAAYIASLVACTREWVRVLKPSGSIFVNLGDSYASQGGHTDNGLATRLQGRPHLRKQGRPDRRKGGTTPRKSLMLLPERYRIACVDELGLIARAVIVWSKPNGLPESVTDRVRRSHEDWVHLTRLPRYFAAVDEIREAQGVSVVQGRRHGAAAFGAIKNGGGDGSRHTDGNPLGKLPGSVWTIATEPLQVPDRLTVDHFAAFPSEWPRRLILGWSPSGVCTTCGEGRRPVATGGGLTEEGQAMLARRCGHAQPTTITGYACACTPYTDHLGTGDRYYVDDRADDTRGPGTARRSNIPHVARGDEGPVARVGPWREYHFDRWAPPATRPAVVLDPFGGTGTTAHVADALGRTGITVDLSADYCRLAAAPELADVRLRKVLGLDKAEPVLAGQMDLLALGDPA